MSAYQYNVPPQAPWPPRAPMPPARRRRMPVWGWVLAVLGGLVALSCAGVIGFVAYVGAVGPGTRVYTPNEVPRKYVDLARGLGLLDPSELIQFFYSDAITDARQGMYFVTDKQVVVYIADAQQPATRVPFAKIESAELDSSGSDWEDGYITLYLVDESVVVFPVSAEAGRDQLMFNAIDAGRAAARPKVRDGAEDVEAEDSGGFE